MATLNISIEVPDQIVPELVSAIQERWGKPEDDPLTPASAQEFIKKRLIKELRAAYKEYKRRQAQTDINIT